MPKELKNITQNVMNKIRHDKIKMRPKAYFIIGSLFSFMGLIASMLISIFLIGLIRFFLRTHGPMAEYRLEQMISSFPWWAIIVAILGLAIGIWILRRYDFSYKINFKIVVIIFIIAIIITGLIIDMTGLNDVLWRKGPMRGMMKQYFQENSMPLNQ
jgi:uncharacterized membrane protein YdcZ (DUF606 family)